MQNSNDNRFFKKDGKTVNKNYIAKKHSKEANQKLFSKAFVFLLILIALASIIFNIYNHPYMKISDVYVTGNNMISDTEIIGNLQSPIGQNIMLYKINGVDREIKKIDYIDDVKIKKVFPNLISVEVSESYPKYYQNTEDATYYINNKGKLLGTEADKPFEELTEITGANLRKIDGENFTASEATMKFITAIEHYPYFTRLKQLNLENKADIGIIIDDIDVKFGDLNNINYKLKLLDHVLNDIEQKGIIATGIDLKDEKNPIVKVEEKSFSENLN